MRRSTAKTCGLNYGAVFKRAFRNQKSAPEICWVPCSNIGQGRANTIMAKIAAAVPSMVGSLVE